MAIRRALATVVALVISATFAASGVAAQQQAAKKDEKKRSKQEQSEIEQVVKLVDGDDGRRARADRHHDDAGTLLHEVTGTAHVRAVRADRE